jgi:uncharacterized protein YdhG (YjbR/CyaY superfamily)
MVKLTPEQQSRLVAQHPGTFVPVPGGWGRSGGTNVRLRSAHARSVREALAIAWRNLAPVSLTSAGAAGMATKPRTIDEYLARLSAGQRAALEKIRRAIKSAAPGAEECISYQIPAFRLGGRVLVWFGAATNHCAFYPGAAPIQVLKNELEGYDTSKGTVRFPADRPLPAALVRKLVRTRIAEYSAKRPVAKARAAKRG